MEDHKIKSGNIFDFRILRRLFSYVKPYAGYFYLLVFLTVFTAVLGPLKPFLIGRYAVDKYIASGDWEGLQFITVVLIGLLILHGVVNYMHTWLAGWIGQNVIRDLRIKLFQHLLTFRLRFFDKTPVGRLITRNVSDIETLSAVFSEGFAAISGDILQLIFILCIMFWWNWKLTLVTLSVVPILIFCTYVFKEKIKVAFNQVRSAVSNLNSFVQEHITGMSIVQIFNSEEREYEKFRKINEEHRKANLKSVLYYSVYFPIADFISAAGTALLLWYGARGVLNMEVTYGVLTSFVMYIAMFFRPIRLIADRFNTLQLGIVSSDRIFKLLDEKQYQYKSGDVKADNLKGHISFNNVWFAYNEKDYVLKNISFDVKPGESVALVGATGAGKSSIINLLNGFYQISSGGIKIDGRDLKEYDLGSLRKQVSVVLQDVFLFSDTIYNNISLNEPGISPQKIQDTTKLLGAEKFIAEFPGGFDYNVMERGSTLSSGQRQIISFIRALVSDPAIIVLDEATSSIDSETEELVQQAMDKMMQGRTSLIIAHRLSTIKKADKIIVLEKGEIVESGTHDELLALEGYYYNLYHMQFLKSQN
ncbi:ABC transporter ATP-binding protein [Cytophagaceae bacterium ABcell3]|nr:ABC transporter ATP-binding protein [Cytophagaceae bacterium ABcell3]